MQSRSARFGILGRFSLLWLATLLLLSPGVARSLGEFFVFSTESAPGSIADGAPNWFTSFYNEDAKVCPDADGNCPIRTLPLVPADLSRAAMENTVVRGIILYGLGYAIILGIASLIRSAILLTPWRAWESALIDRLLQARVSHGRNYQIRAAVFAAACIVVVALAVWINSGFLDWWRIEGDEMSGFAWVKRNANPYWIWNAELTPLQTLGRLLEPLFRPLQDTKVADLWFDMLDTVRRQDPPVN